MPTNSDEWKETSRLLNDLEKAISTPSVPGEMESWLEAVRLGIAKLSGLAPRLERQFHEISKAIVENDNEMNRQAEDLRANVKVVLDQVAAYAIWLEGISNRDVEARVKEYTKLVPEIVERGLNLVVHLRQQQIAATTWFVEALERDRGEVD